MHCTFKVEPHTFTLKRTLRCILYIWEIPKRNGVFWDSFPNSYCTVYFSNTFPALLHRTRPFCWKWSPHGTVVRFFTLSFCLLGPSLETRRERRFLPFCQQNRVIGVDSKYRMSPSNYGEIQESSWTNALIILRPHNHLWFMHHLALRWNVWQSNTKYQESSFFQLPFRVCWRIPRIPEICFIWSMELFPSKNFRPPNGPNVSMSREHSSPNLGEKYFNIPRPHLNSAPVCSKWASQAARGHKKGKDGDPWRSE